MAVTNDEVGRLLGRYNSLKGQRGTWESHWQEVADYCKPRMASITSDGEPGEKKHDKIYDGTPEHALDIFAAGLQSGTMPESSKWCRVTPKNQQVAEMSDAMEWCDFVTTALFQAWQGSNLSAEGHEACIGIGWCGTSVLYVQEDQRDMVRFSLRPIEEVVVSEDNTGRVDTVFRRVKMTARQATLEFGEGKAGDAVADAMKDGDSRQDEEFYFIHAVFPRADRDRTKKDNKNFPFASVYICEKGQEVVSEGGYEEFPYCVWRASKKPGEAYGRSPGMKALGDVKVLQEMERTTLRAGQKAVDPAVLAPYDASLSPIDGEAGKIIWYDPVGNGGGHGVETFPGGGNPNYGIEMADRKARAVERAFFVDVFMMLNNLTGGPELKVIQVQELKQEKMLVLGPLLDRMKKEFLRPLIERTFGILLRNGVIPLPPESIMATGGELDIEYLSPLMIAQRFAEDVQAIDQQVQAALSVYEVAPEVFDNLDLDEAFRLRGKRFALPAKVERSREEVQKIRQERAAAQAAQQQKMDAMMAAEAGGKLGVKVGNVGAV